MHKKTLMCHIKLWVFFVFYLQCWNGVKELGGIADKYCSIPNFMVVYMKMFAQILLVGLCLGQIMLGSVVQAKMIYVNDNLRVGVRAEPSNRIAPFSVVTTGMKLEVLEQQLGYLKIRTNSEEVGWIKDIYVSEQPPAVMRIKTVKTRNKELKRQIAVQGETINVLEMANLALNEQVDGLKKDRSRWQLAKARNDYLQQGEVNSRFWWWISLGGLLLVAAAFSSGMIWHRQQTMKRLGGLRV